MQKTLITIGLVLVVVGLLWPWIQKLGFGRLPGDISVEKENFRFYFPITTMIIISIVLTIIAWLWRK
jgi:heme/copper-type cytochrome/quinol oxidase subunit 2